MIVDQSLNFEMWERIHASRSWARYPPEELVRFIARNFSSGASKKGDALELGCGQGANLWFLAREGFAVAGIDGSASAIRGTLTRLTDEGLPTNSEAVDLRVGNFADLPWPDETFDLVLDIEAVYANPMSVIRSTIAEAKRVLRHGGHYFSKSFGIQTTGYGDGEEVEPGTFASVNKGPCAGFGVAHFFSKSELHALFSQFSKLDLDSSIWTDHGEKIFEWVIDATK